MHVLRPPVAQDRLSLTADGQVRLALKHPWSDGTTHLLCDPRQALEPPAPPASPRADRTHSDHEGALLAIRLRESHRVTSEQLRPLDAGILFITSKRLLFNGTKKSTSIPLRRVIHFTLYSDAIQIEKDSGRDEFFKGDGDVELMGLILEAVLRTAIA